MSSAEESMFKIERLNRDNFRKWKFNVKMLLMHQGLFEIVDGTAVKPTEAKAVNAYNMRDAKALSTICLSIEEDLKNLVLDCPTAKDAWDTISSNFEPMTRARIASLRTEFMNIRLIKQEPMSVFIGRLLRAAQELQLAGKTVPDDEIAYQMLSQLPSNYDNVVIQLYQLDDKNFTSANVRKALIAEHDRLQHRKATPTQNGDTGSALSTARNGTESNRAPRERQRKGLKCYTCGGPHLQKFCRESTAPGRSRVKNPTTDHKKDVSSNSSPASAFIASAMMTQSETESMVHFVIDTAASDHFANDKNLFCEFHLLEDSANLAEGVTKICGIGNIKVNVHQSGGKTFLMLKNVLYAPNMSRNLISGRLIDEAGFSIYIKNGKLTIRKPDGSFFLESYLDNKFYRLNADVIRDPARHVWLIIKIM